MVHALTLLAILLVAAPLARFVPLATLASVLFVVAYNMGEWREIETILRLSKTDIAVWFTTFALTVFADLTVAVGVGMTLAALLYIYRVAETTTVAPVTQEYLEDGQAHILQDKDIPSNVTILRIHGPFLFGTTEKLAEATRELKPFGDVVILRLRNMTALDATGIHALEQFSNRLHKAGKTLLLCGARDQPSRLISGSGFLKHVGSGNVLPHVQAALASARELQGDFEGVGRELALELEHRPTLTGRFTSTQDAHAFKSFLTGSYRECLRHIEPLSLRSTIKAERVPPFGRQHFSRYLTKRLSRSRCRN